MIVFVINVGLWLKYSFNCFY